MNVNTEVASTRVPEMDATTPLQYLSINPCSLSRSLYQCLRCIEYSQLLSKITLKENQLSNLCSSKSFLFNEDTVP